jgi:hypothetical protein
MSTSPRHQSRPRPRPYFVTRRHVRGAVFVESVIVISALSLGLLGLVFFRDFYVKQLGAMRLARASVIAHSMVGCKANAPRDWVGRDLGNYVTTKPEQDKRPVRGKNATSAAPASAGDNGRASRLLGKTGGTTSDGEGLLNPITDSDFSGKNRVTASNGERLGKSQTMFQARAHSRSFVTCGDEVKDGDYDKILEMVKDEAIALFHTK